LLSTTARAQWVQSSGAVPAPATRLTMLNSGTHADTYMAVGIASTIGQEFVDNPIYCDYDSMANVINDFNLFLDVDRFVSVASGNPVNHAPYAALNISATGYNLSIDEQAYQLAGSWATLIAQPLAAGVQGPQPSGTPPPTAMQVVSSAESADGGTGWGIEFAVETNSVPTAAPGWSVSEDSWVSPEGLAIAVAIKHNHPTWSWFDIKGALRQTASNWFTGYSHATFGYGTMNYSAATGIVSPQQIYLEPSGLYILGNSTAAVQLTLAPFLQSRYASALILSCSNAHGWSIKNEYTTADVTAGCNLAQPILSTTVSGGAFATVTLSTPGTYYLIPFTTDGLGHYSRVETDFMPFTVTVT
jgi:hypothetical protein